MAFRITAAKITEAFVNDSFFEDDLEKLPGGYFIEYRQIRSYRKGEDYIVINPEGEELKVNNHNNMTQAFNYYYEIWENYHYYKTLPNVGTGHGWLKELSWIVDFVKYFQRIFVEIENYQAEKARA